MSSINSDVSFKEDITNVLLLIITISLCSLLLFILYELISIYGYSVFSFIALGITALMTIRECEWIPEDLKKGKSGL